MTLRDDVLKMLDQVIDPVSGRTVVQQDMIQGLVVKDGHVGFVLEVASGRGPESEPLRKICEAMVLGVTGVKSVTAVLTAHDDHSGHAHDDHAGHAHSHAPAAAKPAPARKEPPPPAGLPGVKNIIAVAAGKGGVGKSTVTSNLAAALQAEGKLAAALDADVWGYSIPRMPGLGGQRPKVSPEKKILPLEAHGLKVISIGFFLKEDEAVVWRGPMLHKALTQFLEDVAWGELDYLLIDLPPGTGDVSMTLSQLLPQATFMIVTTPQDAAQKVARRAAQMADKVNLEISSVIENMSGFTTPDGERYPIFGEGGGQRLADELDVPLVGQVPLTMPLRAHADAGIPLVAVDPDDPASQAIRHAARGLIALAPPAPIALPVLEVVQAGPPQPVGMSLPMA